MHSHINPEELGAILSAQHGNPFAFLGPHRIDGGTHIRVFLPDAASVNVVKSEGDMQSFAAEKVADEGLFEARIEGDAFPYFLRVTYFDGTTRDMADVYAFGPVLGEVDLHLYGEGNHYDIHDKLGAHLREIGHVRGTSFAVWAPNARRVSVVGDFNRWDGRVNPMRKHPGVGVWEIFIPDVGEGAHYKFEVVDVNGQMTLKSDPCAFYGQHGLQTASLVFDLDRYSWSDEEWMTTRAQKQWHQEAVNIYEVHFGSWARIPEDGNRYLSYRELGERLIPYIKEMGYTHIELMPVAEHPYDGSWGYQVTGYFAPTSRFGNPDEFRNFVDQCHQAGIGVILDWVPGHFPKDAHGLARFDGTNLYEHADPRQGEHRDWGTLIFNYGRNEVRNFLIANALFWLEDYHIDGLRVDAVASMLYLDYSREAGEWIPNAHGGRENLEAIYFLRRMNEVCYERCPGIMTIAEESTAWPAVSRPTYLGGLGFGFKWNMGWMNDSLSYMAKEPVHRRFHQGDITFSLIYAFHEHFILVLSHDEVVHGKGSMLNKMPGDTWQKFANLRMFYAWMMAHPGKKLLFQGGEFGQVSEWNHNRSLDWHLLDEPLHRGLHDLVKRLNHLYKEEPAFWQQDDSYLGFEWIDFHDAENSVVAFMRKGTYDTVLVFAVNATPVVRNGYRFGVPRAGWYQEILNTDAEQYGGSNVGNLGGVMAEASPWQGREYSIQVNLPPLAVVAFKWVGQKPE